jgi:AraC-like DNA-binding protein
VTCGDEQNTGDNRDSSNKHHFTDPSNCQLRPWCGANLGSRRSKLNHLFVLSVKYPSSHPIAETCDVNGVLCRVRSVPSVMGTRRMQTSAIQYRSITGECRRDGRGNLLLWQLLKVQAVVDAHMSEYISSRQLADCVRLSRYHFARAFRRSTGMSPQGYVIRCRIERAQYLMLWTDTTLCRIAFECGFSDQSHFSRAFVKALGETPRAWRRARPDHATFLA